MTTTPVPVSNEEAAGSAPLQSGLLTINQVAALLGFSRWKVYDLINQHGLPYLKVGEHRRIRLESLRWWLAQQECSTDPRIQLQLEERRANQGREVEEAPKPKKRR